MNEDIYETFMTKMNQEWSGLTVGEQIRKIRNFLTDLGAVSPVSVSKETFKQVRQVQDILIKMQNRNYRDQHTANFKSFDLIVIRQTSGDISVPPNLMEAMLFCYDLDDSCWSMVIRGEKAEITEFFFEDDEVALQMKLRLEPV